jgi:hypothetical protein
MDTIEEQVKKWCQARNVAPDDQVYQCDARHAAAVGLPVLAALASLCHCLRTANEWISRDEIEAELRPILSVAVGEGTERLRARDIVSVSVPGVPTIPSCVLETM